MTTEVFAGVSAPFAVLDGILSSDYWDTLDSTDQIVNFAEAGGHNITYAQAERIAAVGKWWIEEVKAGIGSDSLWRAVRAACERSTVSLDGATVDFEAAVQPCSDQTFMDAYSARHAEKFGQAFVVN